VAVAASHSAWLGELSTISLLAFYAARAIGSMADSTSLFLLVNPPVVHQCLQYCMLAHWTIVQVQLWASSANFLAWLVSNLLASYFVSKVSGHSRHALRRSATIFQWWATPCCNVALGLHLEELAVYFAQSAKRKQRICFASMASGKMSDW